ncbi:hypothetical protein COZ71_01145 [Candidatus Desantisbacteria bacterium CG_4_8_14_3_um_filter_40_12]|uniref:Methyltransferase domain-containing protein n=2 Tax=unclassified Candidatus Desantisiibacteriota TaxID=3106372 RepID=A0A2M7JEM4_9BACT|nr:MAG: hypothetical protein COZ71_01145 [Candidatus Desantisbacteria bacterium CG_4_8_14_3_um_filter_40_12]
MIRRPKNRWSTSDSAEKVDSFLKEAYSKQATTYDQHRSEIASIGFYQELTDRFVEEIIPINAETKVLDIASGTGRGVLSMSKKEGKIFGADISLSMCQEAKKKAETGKVNNVYFTTGAARLLPFKENSFDVITTMMFFHLVPKHLWEDIIKDMQRVLKPGGVLILEFSSPFHGIFIEFFRSLFVKKKHSLWPHEAKKLFQGMKIIRKCGSYIPGTYRVFCINQKLGMLMLKLARCFPFNHTADELFYVVRKDK